MMPYNLYKQAKLLDSILKRKWNPASIAMLREDEAKFPYVCRGEIHLLTLDVIDDCERLQRELEDMEERRRREEKEREEKKREEKMREGREREKERRRRRRRTVDVQGMWRLPRMRWTVLEALEEQGRLDIRG
jgi:hypothetical protein